jgi:hypothetical protein
MVTYGNYGYVGFMVDISTVGWIYSPNYNKLSTPGPHFVGIMAGCYPAKFPIDSWVLK